MHRPTVFLAALLALAFLPAARARSGEFVVRLAASEPSAAAAAGPAARARAADRLSARGATPLQALSDGIAPEPAPGARAARPGGGPFDLDPGRVWLVRADSATAARLALEPGIEWVEPNQLREPADFPESGPPDDPFFLNTRQWGLWNAGPAGVFRGKLGADIHALEAWRRTTGSNDLLLAVADTGIDPGHPELAGTLPDGRPRIAYPFNSTFEPSPGVVDSFGHGTPVAGVFGARTNDGARVDTSGVAGVAGGDGALNHGCRIVPIRITVGRSGESGSFEIARAILHATRVGARAVNLSFAGSSPSRVEREALYHSITHGCVVVAASGNRGSTAPTAAQYPAAYAADGLCIQVGASDAQDRRASFSSYGPGLDLVAPGASIWTTYMTYPSAAGVARNGYVLGSGTSFAAPHVTGALGLLAAWRPELADRDFQELLRTSADDIGAAGVDPETAWGRLNVARALESVPPTFGVWHDEAPAGLSRILGTGTLTLTESGPGYLGTPRSWPNARLLEVEAIVAIPDSFVDSVRVWPRVGGTMTARDGFVLRYFAPHAELVTLNSRTFTLRGWVYRAEACDGCPDPVDLPLPLDQARIGFTVIGKVDRGIGRRRVMAARVRVAPNPMYGVARFEAERRGSLDILDIRGRRVRRLASDRPAWEWDGRDEHGDLAPPGIYFVRLSDGSATGRFVRLGPPPRVENGPRVRP